MKFLLELSYFGKTYSGYQKQKNGNSIQEELEKAMEKIVGETSRSTSVVSLCYDSGLYCSSIFTGTLQGHE